MTNPRDSEPTSGQREPTETERLDKLFEAEKIYHEARLDWVHYQASDGDMQEAKLAAARAFLDIARGVHTGKITTATLAAESDGALLVLTLPKRDGNYTPVFSRTRFDLVQIDPQLEDFTQPANA